MNKIKFSITLAASFTLLAVTPVIAQGNDVVHENWSGPYAGLHFGSGKGNADTSFTDSFDIRETVEAVGETTQEIITSQGSGNLSGDITGSIADLFVGYNFHLASHPNYVFGGQLEGIFFSDITLETSGQRKASQVNTQNDGVSLSTTTSQINSTFELHDELTSMFTFLARGGYLIKSNILIYALGGGVEGNFVVPADDDLIGEDRNKWILGYTVGAGLEYKLNDNWSLRGEYRFVNFNIDRDRSTNTTASENPDGPNNSSNEHSTAATDSDTEFNFSMGKIGIVYRFDPPSESNL